MKNDWRILLGVCALVIAIYAYTARSDVLESGSLSAADNFYNLLVQGFRSGHLSLKKEPPPGFTQLSDPYDPKANHRYLFAPYGMLDMSYYKGKLWTYFGVTPTLIVFWPYAVLTRRYLSYGEAGAIFCSVGFLTGVYLLWALWRRYFPQASTWVVAAGALSLGLATGLPIILARCRVNDVAISCGYALTMLALAAIWKALHEPEQRTRWLAGASLAYGLAVGARPSLLFGGAVLLIPVAQVWRERRNVWCLLLAALGPIVLIGLGLMLYNRLRFDNPFEFGDRYQLAPDRQISKQFFSLRYLWFNFEVYFLKPARWTYQFPFVREIALPSMPAGHNDGDEPFGLLSNIPFVWLVLAAPLAWQGRPGYMGSALRWFVLAVVLLFAACALPLMFYFSGAFRYQVDFLPALVLLAAIGILGLERTLSGRPAWRRTAKVFWSLLLGFSVGFNLFASVGRNGEAHNDLGIALGSAGQLQSAIGEFESALRLKPDYAKAHYNLGVALASSGQTNAAIEQWEQSLQIKPDFVDPHCSLGAVLTQLGRVQEAVEHYEHALRIRPDFAVAYNSLAWLLATRAPAEGGDATQSVTLAQRACELTGNRLPGYLDTLAAAYAAANRFDEAVATAEKAVELARTGEQPRLVAEYEARLELYRGGHPYRDSADAAHPSSHR